jgi:ribosome-binding protein aMBF1 (putative translation factor)
MAPKRQPARSRPRSPALGALYDRFVGDDPERVASYQRALANAQVAGAIHDLRTAAGLTQRELAAKVGTSASVICRLEDADYEGHSLSMLRRVAEALDHQVEIRLTPITREQRSGNVRTGRPRGKKGGVSP